MQEPQQYPPGTQKNYNSFSSRDLMMEKGKELEFSRRAGGGKGEPGVPPKEPGIVVEFCGGLGNQLFQICAGYAASRRFDCPLYTKKSLHHNHHQNQVDYFSSIFHFMGTHIEAAEYDAFLEKMFPVKKNYIHNFIHQFMVSTEAYSTDHIEIPVIFNQYFQFYPPLRPYEEEIRTLLTIGLSPFIKAIKCDYLESGVQFDKSAFLHVRRGDYLMYPDRHPVLPLSYYETCIEKLTALNTDLQKIFVFSDDLEWIKSEAFPINCRPDIEIVESTDEIYTLAFMSICKGGSICANSSFSWWGAYLGAHEHRSPVFVPDIWILNTFKAELFPSEWIVV